LRTGPTRYQVELHAPHAFTLLDPSRRSDWSAVRAILLAESDLSVADLRRRHRLEIARHQLDGPQLRVAEDPSERVPRPRRSISCRHLRRERPVRSLNGSCGHEPTARGSHIRNNWRQRSEDDPGTRPGRSLRYSGNVLIDRFDEAICGLCACLSGAEFATQ
jgi:hypothetical protein